MSESKVSTAAPGWHYRPLVPGRYMVRLLYRKTTSKRLVDVRYPEHWRAGKWRFFGPLPADPEARP
jgi:hypothetical protein